MEGLTNEEVESINREIEEALNSSVDTQGLGKTICEHQEAVCSVLLIGVIALLTSRGAVSALAHKAEIKEALKLGLKASCKKWSGGSSAILK